MSPSAPATWRSPVGPKRPPAARECRSLPVPRGPCRWGWGGVPGLGGSQLPENCRPRSSHGRVTLCSSGDLSPFCSSRCPGSRGRCLSPGEPCRWQVLSLRGVSRVPGVRDPACPCPRCLWGLRFLPLPSDLSLPAVTSTLTPGLEGSACSISPVSCSSPSTAICSRSGGVSLALRLEDPKHPWESP